MSVNNSIGSTLSYYVGAPAANDESSYDLLTFVELENMISVGEIGPNSEDITFNLLKSGWTSHINGAKDLGEIACVAAFDEDNNTNIEALRAYNNTNTVISWKLVNGDGRTMYWQGRLANFRQTERSASAYEGRNFVVRPSGDPGLVEVAAP